MNGSGNLLTNNDREILAHLGQTLAQAGLNYKSELQSLLTLNNHQQHLFNQFNQFESSTELLITDNSSPNSPYLMINQVRKNSIDLTTQIDRDLDDDIMKIFYKAKLAFVTFFDQYDRLVQELSRHACALTNQVVQQHSNVRKMYLQGLKNKLIKSYDVKQKWVQMIETMCHEKCLWHDPDSWPSFYILDQTEGAHRERRRLKKSHLFIEERFFKKHVQPSLTHERNVHPLKYLLNNYEDYLAANTPSFENDSDGSFISNYGLNYWKNNEIIKFVFDFAYKFIDFYYIYIN